jgi:anti-anti-sigma regulatory factor
VTDDLVISSHRLTDHEAFLIRARGSLTAANRHELRVSVQKCLVEVPAAIIIDIGDVDLVGNVAAATFVALRRDAADVGPGVPVLLAGSTDAALARRIRKLQPDQRIYPAADDALAAIVDAPTEAQWIFHRLPEGLAAPIEAAIWIIKACQRWGMPSMIERARRTTFDLAVTARRCPPGPTSLTASNNHRTLRVAIRTQAIGTTAPKCESGIRNRNYRHRITTTGHLLWAPLPAEHP